MPAIDRPRWHLVTGRARRRPRVLNIASLLRAPLRWLVTHAGRASRWIIGLLLPALGLALLFPAARHWLAAHLTTAAVIAGWFAAGWLSLGLLIVAAGVTLALWERWRSR